MEGATRGFFQRETSVTKTGGKKQLEKIKVVGRRGRDQEDHTILQFLILGEGPIWEHVRSKEHCPGVLQHLREPPLAEWLCRGLHSPATPVYLNPTSNLLCPQFPLIEHHPVKELLLIPQCPDQRLGCHELPRACMHLEEPLEHDIKDLVLLVDIIQLYQVFQCQQLLPSLHLKHLLDWAVLG